MSPKVLPESELSSTHGLSELDDLGRHYVDRFHEVVENAALRLEAAARDIRRAGERVSVIRLANVGLEDKHSYPSCDMADLQPDFIAAGRGALSAFRSGVGNLWLDDILEASHDAHEAFRSGFRALDAAADL